MLIEAGLDLTLAEKVHSIVLEVGQVTDPLQAQFCHLLVRQAGLWLS